MYLPPGKPNGIPGEIGVSPEVADDVDACTNWLFDSDENGESGTRFSKSTVKLLHSGVTCRVLLRTFEAELGQELVRDEPVILFRRLSAFPLCTLLYLSLACFDNLAGQ